MRSEPYKLPQTQADPDPSPTTPRQNGHVHCRDLPARQPGPSIRHQGTRHESPRPHPLHSAQAGATSLLFSQSNPPAPPINPSTTHAPAEQPEVQSTYAKLPYASSPTEAKKLPSKIPLPHRSLYPRASSRRSRPPIRVGSGFVHPIGAKRKSSGAGTTPARISRDRLSTALHELNPHLRAPGAVPGRPTLR
jgi:hypothetical protein